MATNRVTESFKNIASAFVIIVAVGGFVTKTEVNHADDRKDIDKITETLQRLDKGQDNIIQNQKETQQSIIDGNKNLANSIFEIKLHQQEQDDKQAYQEIKNTNK